MPAPKPTQPPRPPRKWPWVVLALVLLLTGLAGGAAWHEMRTSRWQAHHLVPYAASLTWTVAPGAASEQDIRFPGHGPYNERLGHVRWPELQAALIQQGFEVSQQARWTDALRAHVDRGWTVPYDEKNQAGLSVLDCRRESLYAFRYPYRQYPEFAAIPARVVEALLYIENRGLLDPDRPFMNPAVDWVRFTRAVIGQLGQKIWDDIDTPGGSTLATQIEKYRHSPDGRTQDAPEKLRQMISASIRAYRHGAETLPVRQQLVLDYLNTVPLAAAPRHGEVHGLGDGLWVWFGLDWDESNRLLGLAAAIDDPDTLLAQAIALRHVVALMIAHRRPSWFLGRGPGRDALSRLTDAHLRLMAEAGLVEPALRDAALAQPLTFRDFASQPAWSPQLPSKGTATVRNRLAGQLGISLYTLDRLDLTVQTTLHQGLQTVASDYLVQLNQPDFARRQQLLGDRLLRADTLREVHYSLTLLEATPEGNVVRLQTDTTGQPLDINEGSKLELGSTAKLRVLATYLEMVAETHERLSAMSVPQRRELALDPADTLSLWVRDWLLQRPDADLPATLSAAMERRFSASTDERFFTGGGVHTFGNFRREDDSRNPTVREAMQESLNLPFVRLLRELVKHSTYQSQGGTVQLLTSLDDPRREVLLARFADREGQVFIRRFWRKTEGMTPDLLRSSLLDGLRPTPDRLVAVFRYLEPDATLDDLQAFLQARLGDAAPSRQRMERLYQQYALAAFDLPDRGHVARVHPLELWVVGFRLQHPEATLAQAIAASADERQAVYRWLFRTRVRSAQDTRIATMLEVEAFMDIHRRWARLGYPFPQLVPSLATALGSSGDRPAALAELMGIIVNDGVRKPVIRTTGVDFALETPYETRLLRPPVQAAEQVMHPEVARALRQVLAEVVDEGTARRLSGGFRLADGTEWRLGGKTGTGDNRIVVGGRPGVAMNRTATFVFSLGPHHFGTVTAYVVGPQAARHRFTSALPVQVLRNLGPDLVAHLDPALGQACPAPFNP
ncbi:MAG: transglycosylase domain-containing protein [Burkholderiaceae bacterium]|nr:transglycosylase domain-containing protein [Burkholderiaceae bacterium]